MTHARRSKEVDVFDRSGQFVGRFKSISKASQDLGLSAVYAGEVLSGKRAHCKGYTLKIATGEMPSVPKKEVKLPKIQVWQLQALTKYGNTIIKKGYSEEGVIKAFKKEGFKVTVKPLNNRKEETHEMVEVVVKRRRKKG